MIDAREKQSLIAKVCRQPTLAGSFACFVQFAPLLGGCKIVFGSVKHNLPGILTERTFGAGAAVRTLFGTPGLTILDPDIVSDMRTLGRANVALEHSISLDNQAVSYLEPHLNKRGSRLPRDFQEVFDFLVRPDVQSDPLPYINENLVNVSDSAKSERILQKIRAYHVLRTVDSDWYRKRAEVQSELSDQDLDRAAQESVASMEATSQEPRFMTSLMRMCALGYTHLLKMAAIQFTSRSDVRGKLIELCRFAHEELAIMSTRDLVLAYHYFSSKAMRESFFGKVQKRQDGLFAALRGMAWDIWHLRSMEQMMSMTTQPGMRCLAPALLSFDQSLSAVARLYRLKAIAFFDADHRPLPFPHPEVMQQIADTIGAPAVDQFFSGQASAERASRVEDRSSALPALVSALEIALARVADVQLAVPWTEYCHGYS